MLTRRLDIPFIGPQLMAFPVRREPLEAFAAAYDRALVNVDNRGLTDLWLANSERYAEDRARIGWRVPRATFERISRSVRDAKHLRDAHTSVPDALTASLERAAAYVTRGGEIRPAAWFVLEDAYLRLLAKPCRLLDIYRATASQDFIEALDALPMHQPEPLPAGPVGDLAAVRELTFRAEDGRDVAPEEVNPMRDTCSGPRTNEVSDRSSPRPAAGSVHVIAAIEHANVSIAFDDVLEILVGPYRLSQGPGPFLGCPAASRAFGPAVAQRAPLFRVPWSADFSKRARWIAGASLLDALREVSAARAPDPSWWRDDDELASWVDSALEQIQAADEDDLPLLDPWQPWEKLTATWTVARDRFASLLESAAAKDEAVLLVPQTSHCDMEGANGPRTALWGAPIALPAP